MNVTSTEIVGGTLGYLNQIVVVATGGQGILTWLPGPGAIIDRGQPLYEVDGRAVQLWYGNRPAWRTFQVGMSDGPDVAQLEANLVALGDGQAPTVDGRFTSATAAAITQWQHKHSWRATGQILPGQIVFEPGPVRVASVAAALGAPLQAGMPI